MTHSPVPMTRRAVLGRALAGMVSAAPLLMASAMAGGGRAAAAARPARVAEYDATVAARWFDEILSFVRETPGFSPPVASRAIGYVGVTLYEALLPGMPDHRTLAGRLSGLGPIPGSGRNAAYDWPVVANAALAEAIRLLFPGAPAARLAAAAALEASIQATSPRGIRERSIDRGQAVARSIFEWSKSDGGHEGYLRNFTEYYLPPVGPGLWEPTPPGYLQALQPWWGANRTFVREVGFEPGAPPPYSTESGSAFHGEAVEVYETVNALTAEQLTIARFWSDDPGITSTPPGHSVSILTQVLRSREASLIDAAEAYVRTGIAVADAFVDCWRTKYLYNLLRPLTYIRANLDPGWGDPLPVTTPPFPEYTSGHSVQSAAAAAVLTATFGALPFVDRTHELRGMAPRPFASFDEAAEEAAISRLYGGIHFRSAIERGLAQGRAIGDAVTRLPLRG